MRMPHKHLNLQPRSRRTRGWLTLIWLYGVSALLGCTALPPAVEKTPLSPPNATLLFVTVEVTRVFTREVVVTATLEPTLIPTVSAPPTPGIAQEALAPIAPIVISALRDKDLTTLAQFVQPEVGITFSPYPSSGGAPLTFTPAQVEQLLQDQTKYLWGHYDGSGLPMELTFEEYYPRYIYNRDFANPNEVVYNGGGLGYGNYPYQSLPTPSATVAWVEYVVEKEGDFAEGLIVVFQKEGETWYVTQIIHDGWTI